MRYCCTSAMDGFNENASGGIGENNISILVQKLFLVRLLILDYLQMI